MLPFQKLCNYAQNISILEFGNYIQIKYVKYVQ